MENEQRKRSARTAKPGGKDKKLVKAQSAAEEARRREAVRESLREKLELERRALQVVHRLLEDSVAEDVLVDCARLITTVNYKDTIEERSIAKLCGYPICSSKLSKIPTQQFKINTKTNKVYDISERKCFCSNFCYKASKAFELQISKTPLWLRQKESLPDVTLLKRGDGGISGEEVPLAERRLREEDVENPVLPADLSAPEAPGGPRRSPAGLSHSDSSDGEPDFVSSVVPLRTGPRVHWGELPERVGGGGSRQTAERADDGVERGEGRKRERGETGEEEEPGKTQTDGGGDTAGPRHPTAGADLPGERPPLLGERGSPEGRSAEEAADLLNHCSVQDREADAAQNKDPAPAQSRPQEGHPALTPIPQENLPPPPRPLPGLDITQVGMSRTGAAGLRGLLKADSVQRNLLEGLRRTLREWRTEETLRLLCGADRSSSGPPLPERPEKKKEEEEEELDEDDLEDAGEAGDTGPPGGRGRPSAPAPDYRTLRRQTEEMGLRVKEFYKGPGARPEKAKQTGDSEGDKDPALPLIDSHAQHHIQRRIALEKLARSLRDIMGPLRLTMGDISSDLNRLLRTFRFTNTNIIHKTSEWTLIAVVLLHVLSEVSPAIQEAMESPATAEYLSTLMRELSLHDQDLQSLVKLLKTPAS